MTLKKLFVGLFAILAMAACQKKADYYMTLSQKTFNVEEEGEVITFTLSANVYYRVNNDIEDWAPIKIKETVGDKTTFELAVATNTVAKSRTGRVRFIGDHVTPLYVEVIQAPKTPVGVDPEQIEVGFYETATTFKVLSKNEWTASSSNSNFVLDKTSGEGNATVTVTFPENTEMTPKTAEISVKTNGQTYTVTITQKGTPNPNLSEKGTSNCYLVSEPGNYYFDATKAGNGIVPASQSSLSGTIAPAKVAVLWCTTNTKDAPKDNDAIITNVVLEGGKVKFSTAKMDQFIEGNVVIAAYNDVGDIIWNWHIWLTEPSEDIKVGSVTWMDRNVGALSPSSYKTTDPLACGFHYQWGRKDPFQGAWTFDTSELEMRAGTTITWPAPELVTSEANGSVAYAIANPTQIIYVSGSSYNSKDWIWGSTRLNDLWGGSTDKAVHGKTMFDPCPVGYHVPASQTWADLATELGITKTDIGKMAEGNITISGIGKEAFWLVYPGGYLYDSGTLGGPVGGYSWYASSSVSGVNMLCTRSHTTACNFGGATSSRCAGYSVRCIKD
ncbi:MAG: hypothetical protein HUJ95_04180 [Bacteroidales bacterium]|nr:hypothetical protein [Bacteroidales bacterium]